MKFSIATVVTILLELTTVDPTDAAASSVSSVRGVTSTQQQEDKAWSTTHFGTTRTHRHLGQDNADCLLVERNTLFEDHPEGEGLSRCWVCEFPFAVAQSELKGHIFVDIDMDDVPMAMIDSKGAQSGASILRTTGAYVEELLDPNAMTHKWTMHVPPTASVEVVSIDSVHGSQHSRRLASSNPGTLSVLVVKVIDSTGASIYATNEELYNDFFVNEFSLKTGIESCSKGQLIIEPAADRDRNDGESGVVNGITSVVVEATQEEIEDDSLLKSVLEEGAISNLEEEYGNISSEYDLVILCLPPRQRHADWAAYAYINSWLSVYDDRYCQMYGVQMHEIGHNLGFAHSNQDGIEYGDHSGFMGNGFGDDGNVKMCFNAAKNFQSGWYTNAQESFSPFGNQNSVVERTLIGINDYEVSDNNNGNLLTLRLGVDENDASTYCYNSTVYNGDDYYVGFNLMEGINEGTLEGWNQVNIFHKQAGEPTQYGKSDRIAELNPGWWYKIRGFKGTSIDVTIKVKSYEKNGRGWTAPIEITTGEDTDVITCFNAPKNFQSGLYTNAQESVYPLEFQNSVVERTLIAIDNYQVPGNNNGNLVTLRLGDDENDASNSNGGDYYVGFNLKEGIHNEGGTVFIFHKQEGGPTQDGQSDFIAALDPSADQLEDTSVESSHWYEENKSYTIQGFKGRSVDVTITAKAMQLVWDSSYEAGGYLSVTIEITTDVQSNAPISGPAPVPTSGPAPVPTSGPAPVPTSGPAPVPTNAPTEKPCKFITDCKEAKAERCYYEKYGKPDRSLRKNEKCPIAGQCFCKE